MSGSIYFGPSASCTMVTLGFGGGQIDVVKVTVPSGSSQSFSFTAGGGLTPTSFSLTHGNTQSFTGVTAGSGYSITETVPAGWSASYVVSNGSPPNNILVVDGATTTVTVTNTQLTPGTPGPPNCCASAGPGGAPTSTGYNGNGATNPTTTPPVVPTGGAPPTYAMCNVGGGTPATASDPTDAQNLVTAKTPLVHLQLTLPDASKRRYGKVAFTSGNGQSVSARVLEWGAVSQVLSDRHGSFQANQWTVKLSDYDRALRTILDTASTKHIDGKDAVIYIETAANAAASVAPLVLSRGIVTDWKYNRDLTLDLTVTDPLGYRYSSVSLDRPMPQRLCRVELFPQLPEENSGRPMPIIYGEYSDDYAWSLNPARTPVGILPVVYVGPANSISALGISGGQWHAFLVSAHAISCFESVFGSNGNTSPGSVRIATSAYGTDVLVPGVNIAKYFDITGTDGVTERVCIMCAANAVASDHISGRVPITVNVMGVEATGDGTGNTITEMAYQFQHFLQHWVVSNYLTGSWGSVPAFGDSTPKVRTSSFTAVNNIHKARLGRSTGYSGRMYIGPDQKPAREWNKEWMISGDMRLGVNHHGQLILVTVNDTASLVGLTTYTDTDHIIQDSFEIDPQVDEIFNIYTYDGGVEPATGRKSLLAKTVRHTASITNHGEREAQALTFMATAEAKTADDVAARTLRGSINAPTDVEHDLDLRGITHAIGGHYRVTHYQGIGTTGWTNRVLMTTRITAYPDEDQFYTHLEAEDLHDRLSASAAAFIVNTSVLGTGTIG